MATRLTPEEQYHANLAILSKHPTMSGMLEELQRFVMINIQLGQGGSGHLIAQSWDITSQSWVPLCSPHDPVAEALNDCKTLYTRKAKVFSLIGMGIGYFATEFAKCLEPWQRLVIWELDANNFKAMMHACDISPLFSERRTDVYIGPEIIGQVEPWWLRLEAAEKLWILPPFRASYTGVVQKALYDAIMDKTIDMMRFHAVGLSTWRIFGRHIGDNDLRNMPEYFIHPGFEHLKDLWKDRPAVCVAAGPSLQKNLKLLLHKQYREKLAIISAGTVYGVAHGLGLAPDAVTTIDFQRLNWTDQFAQIPLDPQCPLVYLHSTYPQTPRRWPGPRFVAENASDTTAWIRQQCEGKKSAAQVQTVAHLNLMVALELGANPILLLGQDLSMPENNHHTAGARAQDVAPGDAPADAFLETMDYTGKPVWTRHSFLSMKTVFERFAEENPDRMLLNCSEGGLSLRGIREMPLREALEVIRENPAFPPSKPGALRKHIHEAWQSYKPQVKDTFWRDFRTLRQWVDDLEVLTHGLSRLADDAEQVTVATLTTAMREAQLASDVMSLEETATALAIERWQRVLAQEQMLRDRHAALALFAIRRFDFLELMAVIPPREEDFATPLERVKYDAGRILAVAQMIREEMPEIQRILAETERRLGGNGRCDLVLDEVSRGEEKPLESILREFALERYDTGLGLLKALGGQLSQETVARLQGQYCYHTQQYQAALYFFEQWGHASGKKERCIDYLASWQHEVHEALPAYFAENRETVGLPLGEGYTVYEG